MPSLLQLLCLQTPESQRQSLINFPMNGNFAYTHHDAITVAPSDAPVHPLITVTLFSATFSLIFLRIHNWPCALIVESFIVDFHVGVAFCILFFLNNFLPILEWQTTLLWRPYIQTILRVLETHREISLNLPGVI